MAKRIDVEGLNAWFGSFQALADVTKPKRRANANAIPRQCDNRIMVVSSLS